MPTLPVGGRVGIAHLFPIGWALPTVYVYVLPKNVGIARRTGWQKNIHFFLDQRLSLCSYMAF